MQSHECRSAELTAQGCAGHKQWYCQGVREAAAPIDRIIGVRETLKSAEKLIHWKLALQ